MLLAPMESNTSPIPPRGICEDLILPSALWTLLLARKQEWEELEGL